MSCTYSLKRNTKEKPKVLICSSPIFQSVKAIDQRRCIGDMAARQYYIYITF